MDRLLELCRRMTDEELAQLPVTVINALSYEAEAVDDKDFDERLMWAAMAQQFGPHRH
jgi:hypothetical protein